MDISPRIWIAPAICLALAGLVLFRMISNSAYGKMRFILKLVGFLVMIGGVVLAVLLWLGKIG